MYNEQEKKKRKKKNKSREENNRFGKNDSQMQTYNTNIICASAQISLGFSNPN